jgi:hypothetical protein
MQYIDLDDQNWYNKIYSKTSKVNLNKHLLQIRDYNMWEIGIKVGEKTHFKKIVLNIYDSVGLNETHTSCLQHT